ncbi:hypothetical protein K490DRAFT_72394 [Saccharata proteae CBS 121410]|uniref:AAA+ ATPase domain-containing protein n=1 Tax=Saccharata proteae CBS 121410 TaxID=1314787 RepID=A0A6A5YEC6_9PEZI|nr:hypothetical protein K490DRAFT_72394 [Saccharata proteae CBS 121410]
MTLPSPVQYPSDFDPAIHLHSEEPFPEDAPYPSTHTDELEALCQQEKEITAAKTKLGIVIQHRAWKVPEAFRSEEDYLIGLCIETPVKTRSSLRELTLPSPFNSTQDIPPSSPPVVIMPLISSPVTYPPSSSPAMDVPSKRRKFEGLRDPLHDVSNNNGNRVLGGFLAEDSDEEDDYAAIKAAHNKRKATTNNIFKQFAKPDVPVDLEEEAFTHIDDIPDDPIADEEAAPSQPMRFQPLSSQSARKAPLMVKTCSGKTAPIRERRRTEPVSYEQLVASRSTVQAGRARKSYYGIDIHQLMDEANQEMEEVAQRAQNMQIDPPTQSIEQDPNPPKTSKNGRTLMWSEKYRAKKFTDLVGDERTHRSVLRWLKAWDPIVFPGSSRPKPKAKGYNKPDEDERVHRKILLLTGPPGLGKTTLAHVCARQAGYEVQEINASDERSSNVVRGRIRDMVGTENVKGIETKTASGAKTRKAGKPVCVIVDEVDGVVGGSGGSGGGEGGFVKALIDLVHLDQKNSAAKGNDDSSNQPKRKKKGDKFRLLRPLVLICNDVYHPSLRPLRQSSLAEIIHIRKPPLNMVVPRLQTIFEREGVPADSDGIRRLCEATWGISSRKEGGGGGGTGEGDVRGVMVVGEWVARKLMAESTGSRRLTRKWIEDNVLNDLSHGGGAARGLGRGGPKEVVERVFKEGAGFPKTAGPAQTAGVEGGGVIGVAEATKRNAMSRLREMVESSGDSDRIMTDCFTTYTTQPYQDDNYLSKPTAALDWLHFHDTVSSLVHTSQEWELAPYLSSPILAFHSLFASSIRPTLSHTDPANPSTLDEPAPFTGPSAPYQVSESLRANTEILSTLQSSLSLPLSRIYRSPHLLATELLPYSLRLLSPAVKPVVIQTSSSAGGSSRDDGKRNNTPTASVRKASEKALVARAAGAMAALGVRFERSRVEFGTTASGPAGGPGAASGGWVLRMEPPLDAVGAFVTTAGRPEERVRFAVRSVLDAEFRRAERAREGEARKRRGGVGGLGELDGDDGDGEDAGGRGTAGASGGLDLEEVGKKVVVKKDFFGRVVQEVVPLGPVEGKKRREMRDGKEEGRVWVSFHEGFSNAVRKPVTLSELMAGL